MKELISYCLSSMSPDRPIINIISVCDEIAELIRKPTTEVDQEGHPEVTDTY